MNESLRATLLFGAGVLVGAAAVTFAPEPSSPGGLPAGSNVVQTSPGGPMATPAPPTPSVPGPSAPPATEPPSTPPPAAATSEFGQTPEGPPLPEAATEAPQGATRLERHLKMAPTLWENLRERIVGAAPELRARVDAHILALPPVGEHLPPHQDVAIYLANSRVLLDELVAAGIDVTELSLEIDAVLRPPRGKIPGGPP